MLQWGDDTHDAQNPYLHGLHLEPYPTIADNNMT